MDIKDLNKPQLILLAILLSFVTSIATGIVTVTLMQQAPVSVTAPINRVIQQTVEKIQQVEGKTVTQTVVVKEEDLVVDAIAKNKSAVFNIIKEGYDFNGNFGELPDGQGFVINKDGVIATDALNVVNGGTYFVKNSSGKFNAEFISSDTTLGVAFLKIGDPVDATSKVSFTLPIMGDLSKMKAGQKILVIGNVISSFIYDGDKDIKISSNKSNPGAMVLNLDGEAIGMVLGSDTTSFAPIDSIIAAYVPKAQP